MRVFQLLGQRLVPANSKLRGHFSWSDQWPNKCLLVQACTTRATIAAATTAAAAVPATTTACTVSPTIATGIASATESTPIAPAVAIESRRGAGRIS